MSNPNVEMELSTFVQLGCDGCPAKCVLGVGGLAGMQVVALMGEPGAPKLPYKAMETISVRTVDGAGKTTSEWETTTPSTKYGNTNVAPAGGVCENVCDQAGNIAFADGVINSKLTGMGLDVERMPDEQ